MADVSVAVIIPSHDGVRDGNLRRLLDDIARQTRQPAEVHVITGVSPSGRARNAGARRASADVLLFLDDDVRLGHDRVIGTMTAMLADPGIGIAGASQLLAPDASRFERAAGRQIPRSMSAVVEQPTDSDFVTTACCAIRRETFRRLGGFNEEIPRGVDPEFRARVRAAGLRIAVAANTWYYHPMPATLGSLCRTFFRNGQLSAEAVRRMPGAALENPDGHVAQFVARRSAAYRAGRQAARFVAALVTFRWIGLAAQTSYAAGYLSHRVGLRPAPPAVRGGGVAVEPDRRGGPAS
ncbi:MAG TPA: glycosyltransferase [bacterium]|nr:glycosyltransferase [bacterium]